LSRRGIAPRTARPTRHGPGRWRNSGRCRRLPGVTPAGIHPARRAPQSDASPGAAHPRRPHSHTGMDDQTTDTAAIHRSDVRNQAARPPIHNPHTGHTQLSSWCRVESAIGMIHSAWPDAGTQPARAADPDIADELSHTGSSRVIVDRLLRPITASDESLEKNTRPATVWATSPAHPCPPSLAHNRAFPHLA